MTALSRLEALFPTHGAIDEVQQIGREGTISALAARVRDASDSLLLQPRKQGKSSVAGAAMARIAAEGGIVAAVDCTRADVYDGPSLARALLNSVRSGGVRLSRVLAARASTAPERRRIGGLRKGAPLARELGVDPELVAIFDHVVGAVASGGSPSLDEVLGQLLKLPAGRPAALFLDEFQQIGSWPDTVAVQDAVARFMRDQKRAIAVVVAGSEESATATLFAVGRPLHWDFEAFDLPPIDRVDWHRGIFERCRALGVNIGAQQIDQILAATQGHPLRTMTVAKQTVREARDAGETTIGAGTVSAAIDEASRHPSWRS
jgi:hypothetical protein